VATLATHSTRDHLPLTAGKPGARLRAMRRSRPSATERRSVACCVQTTKSLCVYSTWRRLQHESIYAAPPFSRPYRDESAAISKQLRLHAARQRMLAVIWMRQVRRSRSATKPSQFNREYSDSLPAPIAISSRETAESWRSLRLTLNCWFHGAACSRLPQTGLKP